MSNWLTGLWQYKVQVAPVLLAFAIYELISYIRRYKKILYVPLYFIYPFDNLNEKVATYYNDGLKVYSATLSEEEVNQLRQQVRFEAVWSFLAASVAVPGASGFFSAFFVDNPTLPITLVTILGYRAYRIYLSMRSLKHEKIGYKRILVSVGLLYFFYLGIAMEAYKTAYYWAAPFISKGDWSGLINNLSYFLFIKVALLLFVGVVVPAFGSEKILIGKLRQFRIQDDLDQLRKDKSAKLLREARTKIGNAMINPPGPSKLHEQRTLPAISKQPEVVDKKLATVQQR